MTSSNQDVYSRFSMRVLVLLFVLAGCRQLLGFDEPVPLAGDGPSADSPADATPDGDDGPTSDACTSFSSVIDTCVATPSDPLEIDVPTTYDTDTGQLLSNQGSSMPQHVVFSTDTGTIDAVFATSISIGPTAALTVTGSRPVALVATGTITVEGTIDLDAGGAGVPFSGCNIEIGGDGQNDTGGGAGGGGGGFRGAGADGGNGDQDMGQSTHGAGGQIVALPAAPRAGCAGGRGGNGNAPGGTAGVAGGAILIASESSVSVSGTISASGGGGQGGHAPDGGGAGGGSGGMIVIEASSLVVTGALVANGGGGGEGAANSNGNDGATGNATGAPGGAGGTSLGADGGKGSGPVALFGQSPTSVQVAGGGGGGGGAGFIGLRAGNQTIGGTVSPPSVPWP